MGCKTKKNKRAVKKAASKATSRVEKFGDKAQKSAQEQLDKLSSTVVPAVSEGAKEVRSKASDLVDEYMPQAQIAVKAQGEKLSELTHKIGPGAEKLVHELQDDYFPRARRTADATGTVVSAAVAAAVDAARKELDKGQDDIRKAVTAPTPKQKKGRAGKVLLVLALAAAGAAAGYVAWKKTRPVEDPWAPPADFARAHYPASAADDSDSTQVSDSVAGAEAGDVAQSLQGGAKAPGTSATPDRSSDTTPKNVKVDHATGKDAQGTHSEDASGRTEGTGRRAADATGEQGKVIDPVENSDENPADPEKGFGPDGEKRGNHRGDA